MITLNITQRPYMLRVCRRIDWVIFDTQVIYLYEIGSGVVRNIHVFVSVFIFKGAGIPSSSPFP